MRYLLILTLFMSPSCVSTQIEVTPRDFRMCIKLCDLGASGSRSVSKSILNPDKYICNCVDKSVIEFSKD